MQSLRIYFSTVLLGLTIVIFTACGDKPIEHGTEYVLECPADADTADLNSAYLTIENRLNNFGMEGDYVLSREANRIKVRVRTGAVADNSKMRNLLQSSANLTFRAMYSLSEIAPALNNAQQTYLRINHIDSTNAMGAGFSGLIAAATNDPDGPMIFSCRAKDTTAVMNILRADSIAILFPSDVVFHWGTGLELESGEPTFGLFACKDGRNYTMNGNNVESATAIRNSNTATWDISLVFDPVGSKEFARITKANIGRSLAVELDNFVYNYPTVNSEITGGQAVITGNFTEMEANDLALLLSSGQLPVNFRIVEEKAF